MEAAAIITNTQHLKKGCTTNVGIVKTIHDNQNFTTTEGWYYNISETQIFKLTTTKK